MSENSTSSISTSAAQLKPIDVNYDSKAHTLTIGVPEIALNAGDTVQWNFHDVPGGWTPLLRFEDDSRQGLGPFTTLRNTGTSIYGEGSDGSGDIRTYQAVLRPSQGSISDFVSSSNATVQINGAANSSPRVIVTADVESGRFDVEPESVTRYGDGSIVFLFEGLTANQVPSIQIFNPPNLPMGPFNAFCREANTIAAEGSNGQYGAYQYVVVVAEMVNGNWQEKRLTGSQDPFVYSEEDPVDPNVIT